MWELFFNIYVQDSNLIWLGVFQFTSMMYDKFHLGELMKYKLELKYTFLKVFVLKNKTSTHEFLTELSSS